MKLSGPATRSILLFGIFAVLVMDIAVRWAFIRFVHVDAQNRILAPEHYDLEVVRGEEYRQLSDLANRETALSDGTKILNRPMWEEVVLRGYKPISNEKYYVQVTTRGTAHMISYIEPYLLSFTLIAVCGLIVSIWNLKMVQRESMTKASSPDVNVDG